MEENEEVEEVEETSGTVTADSCKSIVVTEMTRIINAYRDKMFASDDMKLIEGMNKKNDIESCINHIMNNLTSKRIVGGADELTYEYIHEYYVDDFNKVEDKWSQYIRGGGSVPASPGPKEQARKDAESRITEEQKEQFYQDALENAKKAAQIKAEAKLKADEEKRKAKEKELAEKKKAEELAKKEAEAKRKAEEASKQPKQMSLFDL